MKKSLLILVSFLALASLAILIWTALTFNVNTDALTGDEPLMADLSSNCITNTTETGAGTDWPMVNYD